MLVRFVVVRCWGSGIVIVRGERGGGGWWRREGERVVD